MLLVTIARRGYPRSLLEVVIVWVFMDRDLIVWVFRDRDPSGGGRNAPPPLSANYDLVLIGPPPEADSSEYSDPGWYALSP